MHRVSFWNLEYEWNVRHVFGCGNHRTAGIFLLLICSKGVINSPRRAPKQYRKLCTEDDHNNDNNDENADDIQNAIKDQFAKIDSMINEVDKDNDGKILVASIISGQSVKPVIPAFICALFALLCFFF